MTSPIYTLVTYAIDPSTEEPMPYGHRLVGWWPTLEGVKAMVESAGWNLHEAYYTQAVIERVPPGYGSVDSEVCAWYVYDLTTQQWKAADTPDWARQVCNHAMG